MRSFVDPLTCEPMTWPITLPRALAMRKATGESAAMSAQLPRAVAGLSASRAILRSASAPAEALPGHLDAAQTAEANPLLDFPLHELREHPIMTDSSSKAFVSARALILASGVVLMQALGAGAWAQGAGEADPSQAKARPAPQTTPSERAAARKERMAQGRQTARGAQLSEGDPKPSAQARLSRAERQAENARRLQANRQANRRGEFARGGNADAPESGRR